MKLIFFDFEVFFKDWLVVCIDYDTKAKTVICNDVETLNKFYVKNKESIWVGYNNRQYDQFIMKALLKGLDPYEVTTKIIMEDQKGYNVVPESDKIQMYNFDVSTGFHSLKQLESFMGSRIKESNVPFDIKRKLNKAEIEETIEYCTHDVEETINVFNHRREEFDSHVSLIEAFDLPMDMFNKTKAQLSAHVLSAKKSSNREDDFQLQFPDTLVLSDKYQYVYDWYKNPANMNYEKSLVTRVADVEHVFAWGGIHGAIPNYTHEGLILCMDIASMYPAIMLEYGFLSRNVSDPKKYRQIRDTRLILKKNKDPRQAPYKIVLNGTFGASKDKHNSLYDPLMANNVCVAGQLLLLDLIDKIESYGKLVQSNTDGVFIQVESEEVIEKIKAVAKEWEKRTRLDLEWEIFTKIYQKDVNNYIIIDEDGKYKSKGAYVKKLSKTDYDLPILNKALIQYFVNGTPVEKTILDCNDLIEFQKTVKVTSLYRYALHGNVQLKEKVLRVFASKDENDAGVFKVKGEDKIEKIGNTPEHCFINNENIIGESVPEKLDKNYYVELANKRISDFLNPKNKAKSSSISSGIKFVNFNSKETLEEIYSNNEFDSFTDFLVYVTENTHVDKRSIETLVKLNYFPTHGGNNYLLSIFTLFKYRYKKGHIEKTKQSRLLEIYEFEKNAPNSSMSIHEQMKYETEVLGSPTCVFDVPKGTAYVLELNTNYSPKVSLYGLSNGNVTEMKIEKKFFNKNKIEVGNIIKIVKWKREPRKMKVDDEWKTVEGKFDFWIQEYKLLNIDTLSIDKPTQK
jgi:hypothetical protein